MESRPGFEPFGPAHLLVIALTLTVPVVFSAIVRRSKSTGLDRFFGVAVAALLTCNYTGYLFFPLRSGPIHWEQMLPMQLCDWTMFIIIVALVKSAGQLETIGGTTLESSDAPKSPGNGLLELAYFWGIGGSLQAIFTPNLQFGFPDFRFLSFFADHSGIVMGVLYLMISRKFRPVVRSIWRTLAWSEFYLVVTLVVDGITGENYGFLLHKPEAFSILNYLSDWRPLYLLQLNLLALLFFALLYAPFAVMDLLRRLRHNA